MTLLASGGQIFHRLFAYSGISSCHYSCLPIQTHVGAPVLEKQRPDGGETQKYKRNRVTQSGGECILLLPRKLKKSFVRG